MAANGAGKHVKLTSASEEHGCKWSRETCETWLDCLLIGKEILLRWNGKLFREFVELSWRALTAEVNEFIETNAPQLRISASELTFSRRIRSSMT